MEGEIERARWRIGRKTRVVYGPLAVELFRAAHPRRSPSPLTLAVIVVLIVGIVVQLLALAGALPGSRAAQSRVVITGPGRTDNGDQIQAYVLGAVVSPGVYALPRGSRVHDLVAAAGGATADADLARVSLAGELGDGGTIYIPRVGETIRRRLAVN